MTPAILLITILSGHMEAHQAYIIYPSLEACHAATRAVSDTISMDHKLKCIELDAASSPRPKRNPVYE